MRHSELKLVFALCSLLFVFLWARVSMTFLIFCSVRIYFPNGWFHCTYILIFSNRIGYFAGLYIWIHLAERLTRKSSDTWVKHASLEEKSKPDVPELVLVAV